MEGDTLSSGKNKKSISSQEMQKKTLNMPLDNKENTSPREDRIGWSAKSLFSLSTMNGVIYEEVQKELQHKSANRVYKSMLADSSVSTPYNLIKDQMSRPKPLVSVPEASSEEEKNRAKMIQYSLSTMERPWAEYISEMCSYMAYGHWEGEKIIGGVETPYGNFKGLKDILTISQDTVEEWIFDVDTQRMLGLNQDLKRVSSDVSNVFKSPNGKVFIPRVKFLHLRNSVERNNPEGRSVLNSCYVDWKYKAIAEEYQIIGITKDLGGIPSFGIYSEILVEADKDPTSWQAALVKDLKKMGQSMHSGDLSCAIYPIDYDNNGKPLYDFSLKGIEGGGKQYNVLDIVTYHKFNILMAFLADVLALGTNGSGSFALSDNKMSLLQSGVQARHKHIEDMFNHDLIPQIYRLNGWKYDPEKSAVFKFEKLEDGDISEFASAVQKILAVGGVRKTKDIEDHIRDKVFDLPATDETTEYIQTEDTSRSGDGMKEGLNNGTGTSTSSGEDRSVGNASQETT